jgi:hypothetical protein
MLLVFESVPTSEFWVVRGEVLADFKGDAFYRRRRGRRARRSGRAAGPRRPLYFIFLVTIYIIFYSDLNYSDLNPPASPPPPLPPCSLSPLTFLTAKKLMLEEKELYLAVHKGYFSVPPGASVAAAPYLAQKELKKQKKQKRNKIFNILVTRSNQLS